MRSYPVVDSPAHWDHFTVGRIRAIKGVIIHATAGADSLAWLRYASNPPVSCHVLVKKDGTRHIIVQDANTAWHAGLGWLEMGPLRGANVNQFTLGLELENLNDGRDPYPATQIESAAEQISIWIRRHGWLFLLRHGDVDSRKRDPFGLNLAPLVRCIGGYLAGM
jgi:N-acetyl-anhydromuramyl-L-alanine amidase AmpD